MKLVKLIFWLLFISCNNIQNQQHNNNSDSNKKEIKYINQEFVDNYMNDSIRDYKIDQILSFGNKELYNSLYNDYTLGSSRYYEAYFYSFLMAQKYDDSDGLIDIYFMTNSSWSFFEGDNFIKKMSHYYLIKSWLKGNISSKYPMMKEFGEDYDSIRVMNYYYKLQNNLILERIEY